MKKLHVLVFILIINFTFAQTKQFVYEYISIPDSTQKAVSHSELMLLNIAEDKSDYFGNDQFVSDSTLLADSKKGLMTMPPNKSMNTDRVLKTPNSDVIKYNTRKGFTKYYVDENLKYKWTLHLMKNIKINIKV